MEAIERKYTLPAFSLLNLGFRPFFLGASAFAAISVAVWMGIYLFGWQVQFSNSMPIAWHAHEMIFGYALAVVAGFLLTATRNWTGIQTLNGYPLLLLFLLWITARALPFFDNWISAAIPALIDNLFIAFLSISVAIPVAKARHWKGLGIVSKLLLLLGSNIVYYLGVAGILEDGLRWGLYSGLYLIVALILTLGRRVIPLFIERGVGYPVELKNRKWVDVSSIVIFLLFWVFDVLLPDSAPAAVLAGILFILHGIRMHGWYTHGIWKKPLLWILYLGYGSLIIGFALKLAVFLFDISPYLAVHAFAYGGIGMMTIGMMSRVSLGHTGRNVSDPPRIMTWSFLLLALGTISRVILPLIDVPRYSLWIGVSQALWITSFAIFFCVYAPMLVRPRIDGQFG